VVVRWCGEIQSAVAMLIAAGAALNARSRAGHGDTAAPLHWTASSEPASSSSACQARASSASSGSGRCGTGDSQLPGGVQELCRRRRQEQRRPPGSLRCKGTSHERNGAKAGQDDTSGNAHACPATEVAVLPWRDYALHAGSRGICPAPPGGRSGVVILCVHRDASRQLWCRPFRPPIKMISL
jgi:hypothetical protein